MEFLTRRFRNYLQGVRVTWRSLEGMNFSQPAVVFWLVVSHLLSSLSYEDRRIPGDIFLILPGLALAEVAFLASFYLISWLLRKSKKRKPGLVGNFVLLIGGTSIIRGLVFEIWLAQRDLDVDSMFARIPGDLSVALMITGTVAYVVMARKADLTDAIELEKARKELEQRRKDAGKVARQAEKALRNRAQEALLTQIQALELRLRDRAGVAQLATEIRKLVDTEVRPLSREIWDQIDLLSSQADSRAKLNVGTAAPFRLDPHHAFRPSAIWLLAFSNIIVTANALGDWSYALSVLGVSISLMIVGGGIRVLVPRKFGISVGWGFVVVSLLTAVSFLPSWLFFYFSREAGSAASEILLWSATGLVFLTSLAIASWSVFAKRREQTLQQLRGVNQELSRQIALVEQAVWAAKRSWSYLIHGTVQGALTVAHTRLRASLVPDEKLIEQVRLDIERAKSVLIEGPKLNSRFDKSMQEITSTWKGVCDVELEISPSALEILNTNPSAQICVTEICKELIGNSFRHGGASRVQIEISAPSIDDLVLVAKDNGSGIAKGSEPGLGQSMFSELTSDWSLENGRPGTVFRAEIPVSNSPVASVTTR